MLSFILTLPAILRTRVSRRRPPVLNPSGLQPAGHALLVEPYEPDFDAVRLSVGLVIPDYARNNSMMVEMRVRVIALGDMAYRKDFQSWFGWLMTPWRPRCRPGDKVLVQKFSGAICTGTLDGKLYRFINDEDVFVQIAEEAVKPEFNH